MSRPPAEAPRTERSATVTFDETRQPSLQTENEPPPPPPAHTYPCGCPYPGPHLQDCMWALWYQMKENYDHTKTLMTKFMTQAGTLQKEGARGAPGSECTCPAGCHGRDLGQAMGLEQMRGVTVPWGQPQPSPASFMQPGLGSRSANTERDYSVENENRKLMEEQKRIKNTWAQFLNIFDMALDLANEQAQERWDTVQRRKEKQREEREQKKEEERRRRKELREQCMREREEEEGKREAKKEQPKKKPSKKTAKDQAKPSSTAADEELEEKEPEEEANPPEETQPDEPPPEEPEIEEEAPDSPGFGFQGMSTTVEIDE